MPAQNTPFARATGTNLGLPTSGRHGLEQALYLAKKALHLLLSLCTLFSLSSAFAHECDRLLFTSNSVAYVNLINYAVDRGILPVSDVRKLSEQEKPVNPMQGNLLASNSNLTRALALTVGRMSEEEWLDTRVSLSDQADRFEAGEKAVDIAKAATQNLFALRRLPHREDLDQTGVIHATRDGRLVSTATLNGRLGRYSLLDDEFVEVMSDHAATRSELFETKSGKILLAAITGPRLRIFDVSGNKSKQILHRNLERIPLLKDMFSKNYLRAYEPMFFETVSGVQVFMHAMKGSSFLYVGGKAVLPVATISVRTGRTSTEMLSPQISRYNRDGGHIFAAGWLKDWTEKGRSVALVARDVSRKQDVVAHDVHAFSQFPLVNDPALTVLSNRQIGLLPETGEPSVFDSKTKQTIKIDKGERFHLSTTKFFVHKGKTWFAALDLNDIVHSEARLVYGPAQGREVHIVRIPMQTSLNQVDHFEIIEHQGKTYFVILEASRMNYAQMHIYDENEQNLTSLPFTTPVSLSERFYRKTEIMADGRWVAQFSAPDNSRPLFLQVFGPVASGEEH